MLHALGIVLTVSVSIWLIESIIDGRVDKRLRAAGLIAPTPPKPKSKPPSVFLSPRLALIGAAFGVISLLVVIGRFA